MSRSPRITILALAALFATAASTIGAEEKVVDQALAEAGYGVVKKYCYRCHGVTFEVPEFNILDRDVLTASRGDKLAYLQSGSPDKSLIWQRLEVDRDMPPDDAAQPTADERAILRRWIEAEAPFPVRAKRPFVDMLSVMTAIRDDLRSIPNNDQKFQRYFSLTHLYNNPRVTDDEMRLYRAALSKVMNSLSWQNSIVRPKAVDADQTVFRFDLRDLGWDQQQLWQEILKQYPYGLKYDHASGELRETVIEVYQKSGSDVPMVRADWFIATATRPPLYHKMLQLPHDAATLEQQLKVDVQRNFLHDRTARAGFATSGVSSQNRLAERHASSHGFYWKSYDFKTTQGKADLLRFPLGPNFPGNPFANQAFEHDGGEMIFSLPNGLQGYFLVDGKDCRIDSGPVEVVSDALKTSGTPAIVNGLSCMACHKHGVIRLADAIRSGAGVLGDAKMKVEAIFPPRSEMDKLLDEDEARFVAALDKATGEFLREPGSNRDIREFPEPVGAIARLFIKDLGPVEVACELGLENVKELQTAIRTNSRLRSMGLGPIVDNNSIKREAWQSTDNVLSPFQKSASELQLGTPNVRF